MENQLRDLLEAAVGEPPRRVTVDAVRRRVIRRRILESAGIGAVAVVVAGIGVAAAFRVTGANAPSAPVSHAGAPRYYVQASFPGTAGRPQPVVIRATATGAVTATVGCPWPNSVIAPQGITAASNQTFFMICQKVVKQGKLFAVTGGPHLPIPAHAFRPDQPRCWASARSESPSSPPKPASTHGAINKRCLRLEEWSVTLCYH
jgi:hypothetical protein